jgi:hypothetical protein
MEVDQGQNLGCSAQGKKYENTSYHLGFPNPKIVSYYAKLNDGYS